MDPPWKLVPFDFDCFSTLRGGPLEAKINQNSILIVVKNKKNENVDFLYPSLAKSLFLGSHEAKMEGKSGPETIS